MKNTVETLLIAARPKGRRNDAFINHTLLAITKAKRNETFDDFLRTTQVTHKDNLLMKFITFHRTLALALAITIFASLSFTSYAYAIGSNPVTLLRRLLNGGKTVEVQYEGRTFQYGSKHNYSDAAVTAYAELNTVGDLHFRATNAFQVPKDGIEHISDPYNTTYIYPWVGTVESIHAQTLTIHKQYIVGDKVAPSEQVDQRIDLPTERVSSYKQGEVTAPNAFAVGDVVMVYQDAYLEHRVGSFSKPTSITQYFVFGLTHDIGSIQEATLATKAENDENRTIFEPSWGGATNICLNNGADRCDADKQGSPNGENLYAVAPSPQQPYNNPEAIPTGEAVIDPLRAPKDLIIRNTQGSITSVTNASIIIKSSSGALWTLEYSLEKQQAFGQNHKPLSIGDLIVVSVIASVNDLDNRHFDHRHIHAMQRY